jgi:hypothetical protein
MMASALGRRKLNRARDSINLSYFVNGPRAGLLHGRPVEPNPLPQLPSRHDARLWYRPALSAEDEIKEGD